jgi:hypothetical protein
LFDGSSALPFDLDQGDDEFLYGSSTMAHDMFSFLDERIPAGSKEGQISIREAHGLPFQRCGKTLFHPTAKDSVGVDANAFTAQVCDGPLGRPANTFCFDIAVVRGQEEMESPVQDQIEQRVYIG